MMTLSQFDNLAVTRRRSYDLDVIAGTLHGTQNPLHDNASAMQRKAGNAQPTQKTWRT